MKRDGMMIILVLIVSTVCLSTAIIACETIVIQNKLQENRVTNIQANLLLDSKMKEIIYNEDIVKPIVVDKIENIDCSLTEFEDVEINIEGLENTRGQISFGKCSNNRIIYKFDIFGNKGYIQEFIQAKGHIFNPIIDYCNNGLVSLDGMSLDNANKLSELLQNFPDKINIEKLPPNYYLVSSILSNNINIFPTIVGNSKVEYIRESTNIVNSFKGWDIVLFKEFDGFNRDVVKINSPSRGLLKGIIYIEEGDLIISGDINIIGVVILNNGRLIAEDGSDIKISGKLILNNYQTIPDSIEIEYHEKSFMQMAKYLPGFISLSIDSIR